jgi:Golgi apparatus protein 1
MIRLILILILFVSGFSQVSFSAVKGACEEELEKYCSNIQPGEGRIADCLKRYDNMLSQECKDFLTKHSDALKKLKDVCSADAYEYCRDVKTSYRRIVHCLEEHILDLQPDCRAKFKK